MIGLVVKALYPTADMDRDVRIDNEGIKFWNEAKLGPKPSIEFLESKRQEAEAYYAAKAKEQQIAEAQEQIYKNHIAELSKKVMELRFIVAAETGVKLSDISPELEAKLAECDSLKAGG
jgi:hypothetical protein